MYGRIRVDGEITQNMILLGYIRRWSMLFPGHMTYSTLHVIYDTKGSQ